MNDDKGTSGASNTSGSPTVRSGGLPLETRPLTVRLQVADLARSMEFYTGVIGLHLLETTDRGADLGVADAPVPLVSLVERCGAQHVAAHSRLGLYHFAILLPTRTSLGRCLLHLTEAGLHVGSADHWVSEALYLSDPDGLGIELYADRPRESWPRVHGRVQMTTARLDLRDLATAGRDLPWDGLPAGTSIGHVHLHVGAIDAARQFYGSAGLGFDEMFEMPGALFVAAGGYHHHLGLNTWAAHAPSPGDNDAQLLDWRLYVPEAAAAASAARLEARGHEVTRTADGWTARDPWGSMLHVVTTAGG